MNTKLKRIALARTESVSESASNWDLNCGLIVPGLFVGSLAALSSEEDLIHHGVTHVLTAAGSLNVSIINSTLTHEILHGLADHPMADLLAELPKALGFIDTAMIGRLRSSVTQDNKLSEESDNLAQNGVLVHCASGVSRSVGVCCAWLMTRKNYKYQEALDLIRVNRPTASPNIGFRAQLLALESCQGCVEQSQRLYSERLGASSVTDIIRTQREAACGIHEEVDKLENEIREHELTTPLSELKSSGIAREWHRRLWGLQDSIKRCSSGVPIYLEDKPAQSMRKSAASKVLRLLADVDIYSNDELEGENCT